MREIKFRIFDTRNKKIITNNVCFQLALGVDGTIKAGISDDILMQFTGLKDKNGKDIYDGDILCFRANYTNKPCGYLNGVVKITPYELLLIVNDLEYSASDETEGFDYLSEILGNIYENPELLK